jgi:linearmycin/streptolysin S transport system ATP-binding protein
MRSLAPEARVAAEPAPATSSTRAVLETRDVSHRFGDRLVLDRVSFGLGRGEVHALLGPNGAGKTTLIRILAGLLHPTDGFVHVGGYDPRGNTRLFRQQIGFIPSGDRTLYLRISGLENLVFFGRLHGMRRRAAARRALEVLAEVGLEDAAHRRVATYSHGMQKRLSVARALFAAPPVLLVDEATHDLDPEGARRVRDLVAAGAHQGSAVVWATQRLDEIAGFANAVTLLDQGRVRFLGSVPQLMAIAAPRRFVVQLRDGVDMPDLDRVRRAIRTCGRVVAVDHASSEHVVLELEAGVVLGDAVSALTAAGLQVLSCREERSNIEEAFLRLTQANGT